MIIKPLFDEKGKCVDVAFSYDPTNKTFVDVIYDHSNKRYLRTYNENISRDKAIHRRYSALYVEHELRSTIIQKLNRQEKALDTYDIDRANTKGQMKHHIINSFVASFSVDRLDYIKYADDMVFECQDTNNAFVLADGKYPKDFINWDSTMRFAYYLSRKIQSLEGDEFYINVEYSQRREDQDEPIAMMIKGSFTDFESFYELVQPVKSK